MTRWTRSVVVPVAVAVPLLGIATDVIAQLLLRGDRPFVPPWRNPSTIVWCLWGLMIPLVLLVEHRWPLRRPSSSALVAHALSFTAILAVHIAIALQVNAAVVAELAARGEVARFIWLDRLPRYLVLDLLVYALIVAGAHALRSHFALRERERAAAALEADIRRAEVELVRNNIEPEVVFRELAALRHDIGTDAARAERRVEELSDHFERQLATIALLTHETRESLPAPRPERRFLGLTARVWLVLAIAPFVFLTVMSAIPVVASIAANAFEPVRFARAMVYPLFLLPCIVLVVAATTPRPRSVAARASHFIAMLLLCVVLSFVPDPAAAATESVARGRPYRLEMRRVLASPAATLNRLFFLAVAAAVLAVQYGRRSRDREIDEAMLRARLAGAQLNALRMQLHPHFLFNTLNTIAGLLDDDPAAARLMTERLDRFLRMSLELGDAHEVPLREELHFVTTYLEIQRARFGERLRVDMHVDDGVLDALVPPLILQPLVENAIRHGIGPRKPGGTISVRAASREDVLVVSIADDGEGARAGAAPGIGLTNTRGRLQQLHGSRQSVTIRTAMGEGFEVELRLPLRFARG